MSFKKHSLIPVWLCAVAFILVLCSGCVISPRRTFGGGGATPTPTPTPTVSPTPTPTPTPTPAAATGKLYESNANGNSIFRFDNAFTATGNITASATIVGAATTLNTPAFITLDRANDRLYVANNGGISILVFENASTKSGNIAPNRTISGPNTNLFSPIDVAVDPINDFLYVADDVDILVFQNASTTTGDVAPIHDLSLGFTASGIFLDSAHDRLYVSDSANSAIHIYDGASSLDGAVTSNRTLSGAATHLVNPGSIQVDGSGRLIVSNTPLNTALASITIYANAATITGNIAPTGEIKGANTGVNVPDQLAVDPTGTSTVYNVDSGTAQINIFANTGTATGNIAPTRSIKGANTGITTAGRPTGLALDTTR